MLPKPCSRSAAASSRATLPALFRTKDRWKADTQRPDWVERVTSLDHPQLSGLGRNPTAPQDVLIRLATHKAGRHGLSLRRGRLEDAVVEALLTDGDDNTAVRLHGDRISPAMRRRIAGHPDPAIRDAYADSVRGMVDREVLIGIDDLEEAYGRPRAALVSATSPSLRAAVARAWYDRPLAVQVELLADPDPQGPCSRHRAQASWYPARVEGALPCRPCRARQRGALRPAHVGAVCAAHAERGRGGPSGCRWEPSSIGGDGCPATGH